MKAQIEKIRPLSLTSKSFCTRCGLIFAICWGLARFLAVFRSKACFQLKKAFLEHFWWILHWKLAQSAKIRALSVRKLWGQWTKVAFFSIWAFIPEKTGWLCWKIKGSVDVEPPVLLPVQLMLSSKCSGIQFFISCLLPTFDRPFCRAINNSWVKTLHQFRTSDDNVY